MSLLLDALKQAELAKAQQSARNSESERREPRTERLGSALDVDASMEPMQRRPERGQDAPTVMPLPEALEVPRIKSESRLAAERSALPGEDDNRAKRRSAAQESAAALFDVKSRGDRTSENTRFLMLAALGVAALTAGGLYLRDLLDIESGARPFRPGNVLPVVPGGSRPDRPADIAKSATNASAPASAPGQIAAPPAVPAESAAGSAIPAAGTTAPAAAMTVPAVPAAAAPGSAAAPAGAVSAPVAAGSSTPLPADPGPASSPAAARTSAFNESPVGTGLSANFAGAGTRPIEAGADGARSPAAVEPAARPTPAAGARPQTKVTRPGPTRSLAQATQSIPRAPLRIPQPGTPGGLPQAIPPGGDGSIHLTPAKRPAAAFEPTVQRAYAALLSGDFAAARNAYREVAANDPANIDAELGLATVAASTGDSAIALRHYRRALEIAPGNPTAVAGIAALRGSTGIAGDEATLRDQVEQRPDPALYFALGNEYSAQSRWSEAQQSYFDAFRLDSGNPDYAYNLAVSLDHLGKAGPARSYYEQAKVLAAKRRANFDAAAIAARLAELR